MKRNFYKGGGMTLCVLAISSMANAQKPAPNVVFILADDLGYGDVGCYGQKVIKTPNIDSLASEGMKCNQFYAGCTVSAPSRASLLTGFNTGHTTVRGNNEIEPEGQMPMNPSRTTLGNLFKSHGYATGMFGKWGLGYPGSGSEPQDRGFDKFYGYNCQRLAHYYYPPHLWNTGKKENIYSNLNNGRKTYAPELIQKQALGFITESVAKGKPFFAMLTYTLPHAELNLPHDAIYEMYKGKVVPRPWDGRDGYPPSEDAHASFAAMITQLDAYVGEVVQHLRKLGVDQNTIIIFTSDNGPHLEGGADPDYFDSNGPLRGYKRDLYEGGIREPMIVVWPHKIKAGSVNNTAGAFWDMMPTFADMLGSPSPKTDGISLLDSWISPSKFRPKHRTLYWEYHEYKGRQALLDGDWKLIVLKKNTDKPVIELYNIKDDLSETHNLADKYPERVRAMLQKMEVERTPSKDFPFRSDSISISSKAVK